MTWQDIPTEFAVKIWDAYRIDQVQLSQILQLSMREGIVSAPCHVMRDRRTGKLIGGEVPRVFAGPPIGKSAEHWEGQE